MSIQEREKQFYDKTWQEVQIRKISGKISIPGIDSIKGKKILICSCGTGVEPVLAAKQGAETFAFDISETAIKNTREMAKYNNVVVKVDNMDFHNLLYEDNIFDILYGSYVLHHIDCSIAGKEIYRVLKPGGIAFFRENSDRNSILRFLRRLLFGKPGGYHRQKILFIKRIGSSDEDPLTQEEVGILAKIFKGNIRVTNEYFCLFSLLNHFIFRNSTLGNLLWTLDSLIGNVFPFIKKYSFLQEIWLKKPE